MNVNNGFDCIVVGTGPGGATVVRELVQKNYRIVIVEEGTRLNKTGFLNVAPKAFLDRNHRATVSDGDVFQTTYGYHPDVGMKGEIILGMMTKIRDERAGVVYADGSVHKRLTSPDLVKLDEAHSHYCGPV